MPAIVPSGFTGSRSARWSAGLCFGAASGRSQVAAQTTAILITGCSSGIGRATAERLAAGGHRVYASARRLEAIADLADKGCRTLALDVTDEHSMRAAVAMVEEAEGAVGALVNNAGYSQSGAVETLDLDDVRRQFETNVFGLIRMCQLVLPGMRQQRSGRIVNVSSMGGKLTFPGGGAYHATKHAVEAISDALRFEVKGFGVDVVVIEPGLIKTRFGETAKATLSQTDGGPYAKFNEAVAAATVDAYEGPLSRLGGGPEAVARTIEKALTAERPRTRYPVTPSAWLFMGQRAVMTDRMWDAMAGTQFPHPS
jgi:NAD(P)-dependent dehydrogenase (short-subunit alcohol dehydrogenase family)